MLSLDSYRSHFEQHAHKYIQLDGFPTSLYEPIRYLLSIGGKRIRPSLVYLGSDLYEGINEQTHLMASVVETFHNFTLMHDDIMDDATTRRGKEVVHKKYNLNRAILSGDMMSIMSFDMLIKLEHPRSLELISRFTAMAREICEGQELDMIFEEVDHVSQTEYIQMIRQKTAVLIGYCLYSGAVLGGSSMDRDADRRLALFGEYIGIAFQIMDDYLDAYGQSDKVGKKRGGDILQSKKTILYVLYMEKLKEESLDSSTFIDLYSSMTLADEQKISKVLSLFDKYAIGEQVLQLADKYYHLAIDELEHLDLPLPKKEILTDFAQTINVRTF